MKDLTEGRPAKLIISLALPMLIGNIFQQIYNVVDTAIVGRYLGEEALAGVGSTGTIISVLLTFVFGLSTGAGLIIAQCFGNKDMARMRKITIALIWTSLILAFVMSSVGNALCEPILHALAVPDNVFGYSKDYLNVIFSFIYGVVAYNAASGILRSVGDSKTPLVTIIASSFVNIGLDVLFVVRFGWGVKGVAYATIISQVFSAILCIGQIVRKRNDLGLVDIWHLPERKQMRLIAKTGFPSAFQSCMISLGGVLVQRLINSFGASTMAAYVAATKVDSITIQIVCSISAALCVFTGQNVGSGDYERVKQGLYDALKVMMSACVILAIGIPLFRYQLIGIFLDASKYQEATIIGATYLSIMGFAYMIAGIMNTYLNVIKGAGDVNTCMIAGLAELGGKITFAYILSYFIGVNGIWIATPLSWGCGCIIPVVRYYSGKWKTKKLI